MTEDSNIKYYCNVCTKNDKDALKLIPTEDLKKMIVILLKKQKNIKLKMEKELTQRTN